MVYVEKSFFIQPRDFTRAGEASIQVQGLLKKVGYPPDLIRRTAICAYESEMNVVMHGGEGQMRLIVDERHVVLEVEDSGKGIEDIELALQEGYSTASQEDRERGFGAGMGLPNIKKNTDHLDIRSWKGEGTSLRMVFNAGCGDDGSKGNP